jgi:ABC-type multidrug transport system ATPase subunit
LGAIAQEPKILLADEPVACLDPELSVQVMSDLARVAREMGVLTLINIHHVELAKEFADRLVGIAQGKVVFDGAPDQSNQSILDHIYCFDKHIVPPTPETSAMPVSGVLGVRAQKWLLKIRLLQHLLYRQKCCAKDYFNHSRVSRCVLLSFCWSSWRYWSGVGVLPAPAK